MPPRQRFKDHQQEQRLIRWRVIIVGAGVTLLLGLLVLRLAQLQIVSYSHFSTLSQNNRVRMEALPPPRGLILDRNGVVLAENRPAYQLELIPEQVPDLEDTLRRLGELIEFDDAALERFQRGLRRQRKFQPAVVKFNLSDEEIAAFAVNRHLFPGVEVQARPARHYPHGASLAHVLGYMGRIDENALRSIDVRNYAASTHIGKAGIERRYEAELHGRVGYQQVEANVQGRVLRVLEQQSPIPGKDLRLTLDLRLQKFAESTLEGRSGAIVAMDPRNGEVLAMVSWPSFDPNLFLHGIRADTYSALLDDPGRPLFNRVLAGQYPPGSTLKPALGLGGLELGLIVPSRSIYSPGYFSLPNQTRRFRDWTYHGWVNLDRAIAQSSDVYFYDLGHRMGIDRMAEVYRMFGLGQQTGIDLLGERAGLVPTREWKQGAHGQAWFPGETLIAAIGQGYMLATPLQLASVASTLAMRGHRVRPRLLADSGGSGKDDGNQPPPVTVTHERYWDDVLIPMEHVMHKPNGTAFSTGRTSSYRIAGKTGTAQVFGLAPDQKYDESQIPEHLRDHALFVGFAPAEDPRIAVSVIVENGGSGGRVAAPVARRVMDYWLLELGGLSAESGLE